jgi:hypothetical protein
MPRIDLSVHVAAPLPRVFAAVSDHESFLRGGGARTEVVRPGALERNGLGCMREVRVGRRVRFVEEITAWSAPHSFEYLIRECSLPMRHLGGKLEFTPSHGGTEVAWTSDFEVPLPFVGRLVGRAAKFAGSRAFRRFLVAAKARLERA